jgi:hypothetical protein
MLTQNLEEPVIYGFWEILMVFYKWLFQIYNFNGCDDLVVTDFNTKAKVIREFDPPRYFLTSLEWNKYESAEIGLINDAKELINEFHGTLYILNLLPRRFYISPPIYNCFSDYTDEFAGFYNNKNISYTKVQNFSEKNSNFAKIIRLLGRDCPNVNWVDLYRIYELILADKQNRYLFSVYTKDEWGRFKRTANSPYPEHAGDDSRHGFLKGKPMKDPLPIEEARTMILRACQKWIEQEISIVISHRSYRLYMPVDD